MNSWSNYFSTIAGAGATLTGLLFVAVSINLSRILALPGLTGRVAESLVQLFSVVAIATTFLIPGLRPHTLGIFELGLTLMAWTYQACVQGRYVAARTGHPRYWILSRIVQTQLASIPFFVSGILLIIGSPAALYWSAAGFVLCLAGGIISAWVLLIEILR
jgi:modulator of FtsH protease